MSDLRKIHTDVKIADPKGMMIGAAMVGLAVIGLGVFTVDAGWWKPAPHYAVSDSQLPQAQPLAIQPGKS